MDLLMEETMMVMLAVRETLCVGAITVKSLDHISTPKMTVVTLLLL